MTVPLVEKNALSRIEVIRWWGKVAKAPPLEVARFLSACLVSGISQALLAGLAGLALRLAVGSGGSIRMGGWLHDPRVTTGLLTGLALIRAVAGVFTQSLATRMASRALLRARQDLLSEHFSQHKVASLGRADHTPHPSERLAALGPDLERTVGELGRTLLAGVKGALELIGMIACAFFLSRSGGTLFLCVLALFLLILQRRERRSRAEAERTRRLEAQLAAHLADAVRRTDLLVAYGAEATKVRAIAEAGRLLEEERALRADRKARSSAANEVLGALLVGALLIASALHYLSSIDLAPLPFALFVFLSYRPMRALAELDFSLDEQAYHLPRPSSAVAGEGRRSAFSLEPLSLHRLSLPYGSRAPLSVQIPAGAFVAIRGPNGSGKTTLLRTLLGLNRPLGGEIRYGNTPLNETPPQDRPFAWMPQDAELIHGTAVENVLPNDERHRDVRLAEESPLVASLGKTVLGEDGRSVSRGERQWISLQRALRTDAPVLLLDEPTTGLDGIAQRRLLDEFERVRGDRTILLVTHDPALAALADYVFALPEGTLVRGCDRSNLESVA